MVADDGYVRIFDTTLRDGEQSPGATMTSSESTSRGSSASIICLILYRTASAECASPAPPDGRDAVKKYFISNNPRGVATYLFDVARETVDS